MEVLEMTLDVFVAVVALLVAMLGLKKALIEDGSKEKILLSLIYDCYQH